MNASAERDALKNLSGTELAQIQTAATFAPGLAPAERVAAMRMIADEVSMRSTEGLQRKAERFLNRHGQTVAAVALGAFLGVEIGE